MLAVTQETLSYCTSCKLDLNHIIVAMQGTAIAKVQCLTCKKEHRYRTPHSISKQPSSSTKQKAPQKAQSIETEWEKRMHIHAQNPTKSYSTREHFQLGDRLKHPQFGSGIVEKIIHPNKIEVIFQTTIKILIHKT